MKNPPSPRTLGDSKTSLTLIVLNPQLNPHTGFCDEGQLLHLADDAAYIAAMRHALCKQASTGAVSHFKFVDQAKINDLVACHARVAATGSRSMLVETVLEASGPPYTQSRPLAAGDFVYVLADADYEPLRVPEIREENAAEQAVVEAAGHRLRELKARMAGA